MIEVIKCLMANLTPMEFINLFPITKDYDGKKWQTKDYFYTMEYIRGLDKEKPIGEEIDRFLWEYHNWTISHFVVNTMSLISNLRRLEGGRGIMEEWAEENGIKTYTMYTDTKGKQYMTDNETGKTSRVRKRIPRFIKVLKS